VARCDKQSCRPPVLATVLRPVDPLRAGLVFRKTEMKISIFRLQNPFISGGPENPEKVNFRDSGGAP